MRAFARRARGVGFVFAVCGALNGTASAAEPRPLGYYGGNPYGSTGRYVHIPESQKDPDRDFLWGSASVYYAEVASNFLNYGLHGQGTIVVSPALEIQGAGYLNLPGSNIALLRAEASAFLGIPWLSTANYIVGSSTSGTMTTVEYVPVANGARKKFGLDGGLFFDRHESKQGFHTGEEGSPWVHYTDALSPVTSLAAFAGIKWVTQSRIEGLQRLVFYVHAIYAFRQSANVDVPTGAYAAPLAAYGGRAGTEFFGQNVFCKLDLGIYPSLKSPDASMFLIVGWRPRVQEILGISH